MINLLTIIMIMMMITVKTNDNNNDNNYIDNHFVWCTCTFLRNTALKTTSSPNFHDNPPKILRNFFLPDMHLLYLSWEGNRQNTVLPKGVAVIQTTNHLPPYRTDFYVKASRRLLFLSIFSFLQSIGHFI